MTTSIRSLFISSISSPIIYYDIFLWPSEVSATTAKTFFSMKRNERATNSINSDTLKPVVHTDTHVHVIPMISNSCRLPPPPSAQLIQTGPIHRKLLSYRHMFCAFRMNEESRKKKLVLMNPFTSFFFEE